MEGVREAAKETEVKEGRVGEMEGIAFKLNLEK